MAEHTEKKKEDVIEIPVGSFLRKIRNNPWIIASIVLFVLLIISLFMRSGVSGQVSANQAGQNLVSFINGLGNGQAQLVSSVQQGSLYNVTVNYQSQKISVYVTLDGKNLITQPVPLTSGSSGNQAASGSGNVASTQRVNITIGNAPVIGNVSAPVTIVEFADFSCPYCEAASGDNAQMSAAMQQQSSGWEPIVTNLMKDYVATGKVRFAVKYDIGHTGGHPAQLVAWCLNDQSSALYWKFYSDTFAHQSADTENITLMESDAKSLGADMVKLQSCLDSNKYQSRFDQEQSEATKAGVSGTPAFFINGRLVEGAVPYSQFKQIIDSELNSQTGGY